ncbi:MAG: ADOP family duplicated permease [Gemmatimonadaceae bacterium]
MSLLDGLRYRLAAFVRPRRFARELDEELRFHVALEAMQKEHGARGALSPEDARYAALRRFGSVTNYTEEARHVAGLSFLDVLRQDLRFALRSFRRTPGFTAVAVLTLAVGIGANTAIFSAVNAMLLRPLPYREPERLMKVSLTVPARGDEPARDDMIWSWPKARTFREQQHLFSSTTLYTDWQFTVRGGGEADRVAGELTDAAYLPTLGLAPQIGRSFTADEDTLGGPKVALISDALWQRRWNADPRVLGQTVNLDGQPYVIVGVAPRGFRGLSGKSELWVPLITRWEGVEKEAWSHSFWMVGRLAPGVSVAQAKAVVPELGRRVDAAWPHPELKTAHWGARAGELDATRVSPVVRRSLLVLLGAVGLVLLIACANVANLFLVRAAGRRREIAVRLAVGAGRGRLVRQLLTESVLLAGMGGLAGLLLAVWGVKALSAVDPRVAIRTRDFGAVGGVSFDWIKLDVQALAFAALVAVGTGILFGLVPALRATRLELTGALKDDGSEGRRRARRLGGRSTLAALEIALALVLLAGSGLMLRSLANLMGVNPGFRSDRVLTLRLNTPDGADSKSWPRFWSGVVERVSAVPGVQAAAIGNCAPLSGGCNGTVALRRDRPVPPPGTEPSVGIQWITPEWLETMGVPLVRGRRFGPEDRVGSPKVVLVSQAAARRIWGTEDPVGKPVSVGQGGFWEDTATVVGVVGDVRYTTLDAPQEPDVYLSYAQSPYPRGLVFVRTAGDPLAAVRAIRAAARTAAPDSPIYDVKTLAERTAAATSYARYSAALLGIFALVALALATVGVYGVVSYGVAQRTREIGVRVALGAQRRDVLRLIVGQGAGILVAGGVLGLAASAAATRVLRTLLFDVAPGDPATLATMAAILGAAVLAASFIPARRAATIPPTEALREQ